MPDGTKSILIKIDKTLVHSLYDCKWLNEWIGKTVLIVLALSAFD